MASIESSREMQRLRKKLGIELLWIYLLSLLKEKPSHAYVLRKQIEGNFGFLPGSVTAYVVLYKLQKRGFVSAEQQGNKTVYSITEKGKDLLKEAKKELEKMLGLVG